MRQGDIVYRESRSFGCEAILMQRRKGAENRREVLKAYENGLTSYSWFRVERKKLFWYVTHWWENVKREKIWLIIEELL